MERAMLGIKLRDMVRNVVIREKTKGLRVKSKNDQAILVALMTIDDITKYRNKSRTRKKRKQLDRSRTNQKQIETSGESLYSTD